MVSSDLYFHMWCRSVQNPAIKTTFKRDCDPGGTVGLAKGNIDDTYVLCDHIITGSEWHARAENVRLGRVLHETDFRNQG